MEDLKKNLKKIQDHLNIKDPKNISKKLEKKELTETKDDMEKINCKKCNDLRWISLKNDNFKLKVLNSLDFGRDESIENITLKLNKILEKMIINNPEQWIWTHNRWK